MKKTSPHHIPPHAVVRFPLMMSLLTAMAVLSAPDAKAAAGAAGGLPRVVVSILVDQLRTDYMNAFMPLYGDEGFVRLLREGRVYSQAEYPHYRPDCASAAATLAGGTTPYNHGIIGRRWLNRETLCPVNCVDDSRYAGLQTADASAPTYLGVSTLGDELKVATGGKSIVYSIAPGREAAILTAGHAADGAFWIDDRTGRWCSTDYYAPALPAWVTMLNSDGLDKRIGQTNWKPSNELVGNFSYFLSGGMHDPFSHKFKGDSRFASFKTSGLVNCEVLTAAQQCINSTTIGVDQTTDYLAVTFYAGNFEHKSVSEVPIEQQDTYVRLDQALADLIKSVEHKVGAGNALFVLTSTGYADEDKGDLSKYRIPTGTFDVERAAALLNMYLVAVYGQGQFVEASYGTQLYFDHKLIEQKQINLAEMLERSQDFLLQLSGVKDVYTSTRLLQGAWTPGISRIRGSYNQRYSGDIMIEVAPGWHYINPTRHDHQLARESYIPFPIIFMGQGVTAEEIDTPVTIDCIAPTISKAIRIRAPNACNVAPLF